MVFTGWLDLALVLTRVLALHSALLLFADDDDDDQARTHSACGKGMPCSALCGCNGLACKCNSCGCKGA